MNPLARMTYFIGQAVRLLRTSPWLATISVLTLAKKQLVAEGEVDILVNDDPSRSPKVEPGQSLLSALASAKIFVPSALTFSPLDNIFNPPKNTSL